MVKGCEERGERRGIICSRMAMVGGEGRIMRVGYQTNVDYFCVRLMTENSMVLEHWVKKLVVFHSPL